MSCTTAAPLMLKVKPLISLRRTLFELKKGDCGCSAIVCESQ
jgi:hypothetical protein